MPVRRRRQSKQSRHSNLITYSDSDSVVSDQFRAIRTNINFLQMEREESRIILITSPGKGEGKSTTAANLAVSIAQQNDKVLLIDSNLRDPIIHKIFRSPNLIGLTDVITKKVALREAIHISTIAKLNILTSGPILYNPAELIASQEMTTILNEVADDYDIVLIDSPTILDSTETRILANLCDGVVLVLNRGKTTMEKALDAKRILELAHAKLVGTIINEK